MNEKKYFSSNHLKGVRLEAEKIGSIFWKGEFWDAWMPIGLRMSVWIRIECYCLKKNMRTRFLYDPSGELKKAITSAERGNYSYNMDA